MSEDERQTSAILYYFLTSGVFLYAAVASIFNEKAITESFNPLEKINLVILLWMILRNGFALVFILLMPGRERIRRILATQLLDTQINRDELFLLLFLVPMTYIVLKISYSSLSSMALAYFYTTTAVLFYRETMRKLILKNG